MLKWILILWSCIFFCACSQPSGKIALTVDGEAVDTAECNLLITLNRAKIISYIQNQYHAEYNQDFWTSSYNGTTPLQMLKDTVQQQAVTNMVKRILSRKMGIVANVSYDDILDRCRKENERRKHALQNDQPIYGVKYFDVRQFYGYYLSYLENAVKDKLIQGLDSSDEMQLNDLYEQFKTSAYSKRGSTKIEKIILPVNKDNQASLVSSFADMQLLADRIRSGKDPKIEAGALGLKIARQTLTFQRAEWMNKPLLYQTVMDLEPGEISNVVEESDNLLLVKCVSREKDFHEPFERVKELVKKMYANRIYQTKIEAMAAEAKISNMKDQLTTSRLLKLN